MAFPKMAEVNGTFFRVHHGHSAEASFALNPNAAEFFPGQKSHSLGQAAKYEVGNMMARMEIYCHNSRYIYYGYVYMRDGCM